MLTRHLTSIRPLMLGAALLLAAAPLGAATLSHTTANDFLAGVTDGGVAIENANGGELGPAWWGRLSQAGYAPGPDLPGGTTGLALVASHGRVFALGGSSGSPTASVYAAPVAEDGTVGSWSATTSLPGPLAYHAAAVADGCVFVSGGSNGASVQAAVYSAPIQADGTLGSWSAATSLPAARQGHAMIAADGYLFVLGGEPTPGAYSAEIYAAPVQADGSLGAWTSAGSLPGPLAWHSATVSGTNVIVAGGGNAGGVQAGAYRAALDGSGGIGAWTALSDLPAARCGHRAVAAGGHLLIIGGTDGSTTASTIFAAALDRTGMLGPWMDAPAATDSLPEPMEYHGAVLCRDYLVVAGGSSGHVYSIQALRNSLGPVLANTSLPAARSYVAAVANDTHVFALGGWTGSAPTAAIYSAPIGQDGALGAWSAAGSLPVPLYGHCAVLANGYLIVAGGDGGSGPVASVYRAPVNPDGTIGTFTATTSLPWPKSMAAAVAAGGYLYFSGGYDGFLPAWEVYSAPINANGTVGAWTTLNPMPTRVYLHAMTAANGYLYASGGNASRGGIRTSVYAAALNGDGTIGSWSSVTSLPQATYGHGSIASAEHLYVLGGNAAGSPTSLIRSAALGSGGALGAWADVSALPQAAAKQGVALGRGYLVVAGGEDGGGATAATCTAPKPGPMQIGRFTSRFALGPDVNVNTLSWTGTAEARYRTAPFDTQTYGAWSGYATASPVGIGSAAGCIEYELLFDNWAGEDQQVEEVALDYQALAPAITSPTDGSVTNNESCTVGGTASAGSTVRVYRNDVLAGEGEAPSGTFSIAITLLDGDNELKARSYYGEVESPWSNAVHVTLDQEPPTVTVTSPDEGEHVGGSVTVTASASDNVAIERVEFYLDDELKTTDSTSPYQWAWDTTGSSDGSHTVKAVAYDTATNSAQDSNGVVVDNDPPAVASTDPADGESGAGCAGPITATFDEEMDAATITGSTFLVEEGATPVSGQVSYDAPSRTASFAPDQPLTSMSTFTATVVGGESGVKDLAGNPMAADYVWSFSTQDGEPPTVTLTAPAQGEECKWHVTVSATASDNIGVDRVEFSVDGQVENVDSAAPYEWTWDTMPYDDAAHTVTATAYDAAGNFAYDTHNVTTDNTTFEDVPRTAGYWRYVEALYRAGITQGCGSDGQGHLYYCPSNTATRAQMAVYLVRATGKDPLNNPTPTFSDVPPSKGYYGYVERLADPDSWYDPGNPCLTPPTQGCGPGLYCPDALVTRAQVAVFLVRATGKCPWDNPTPTFSDVPPSKGYYGYVERLADPDSWNGDPPTQGCGPGVFCPDSNATRAQMAVFLVRAFQIPY